MKQSLPLSGRSYKTKKSPKVPERQQNQTHELEVWSTIRLTVEEVNPLSIYHEGSKAQLMVNWDGCAAVHGRGYAPLCRTHLQKKFPHLTEKRSMRSFWHFAADEV